MSPDGSMKRVCRAIGALAVVLWGSAMFAASQRPAPAAGDPAARVDFETAVRPIVAKHCLECHSQDARKGGLSLATYADMLDGGKDGPVIRPGNGAGSLMIQRLMGQVDERMPKDADPLSDQRDRDRTPVDRRGRARDACVTGGATALGGAARADAAGRAAADLARLDIADRSPRCHVPARPPGCQTRRGLGRAVRPPRVSRRLGTAAVAGRGDRVHGRPVARQARRARDAAAGRRRPIRRALDFLLERSAPQRRRRDLLLGAERPPQHHAVAALRASDQPALRSVRQGSPESSCGRIRKGS